MGNDTRRYTIVLDFTYPRSPAGYFTYQNYYLMGLNAHPMVRVRYRPAICSLMIKCIQRNIKGTTRLWKGVSCKPFVKKDIRQWCRANHVGRYLLRHDSQSIKIAIDSADSRGVRDPDALQWSDIYFKANKWRSVEYPDKVFPLINGNGYLTASKIRELRSFRNTEKKLDLIYWAKIWEPKVFRNDQIENVRNLVEHQIRLFEHLSRLRCNKNLLALLPRQLKAASLDNCKARLASAGVRWQHGWEGISTTQFWQHLASAKLVFVRPGNHLCVSWRMIDLLCMGACVIYDGIPYPEWYKPLKEGEHYFDGGCRIGADYALPPRNRYLLLKDRIEEILSKDALIERYRENGARYFDTYADPQKVAQYILDTASRRFSAPDI